MPTFGSLFAGIGGIDLGLERAGWTCRWQVEWDDWCQRVLAKHWPDVPRYGDITVVDWSGVEPVDLLAGGFPCQPVSNAGRKLAQDDARWLWPEFLRAIRELRPRLVLVENVPGLLERGMGDVLGGLAESGYDAEWDCIPAAAVGAPHLRDRVWTVAYPARQGRLRDGGNGRDEYEGSGSYSGPPDPRGSILADADHEGLQGRLFRGESGPEAALAAARRRKATTDDREATESLDGRLSDQWRVEPDVGRVAHGVPSRVDRLRGLGNAVVPQVAEVIGRQLLASIEAAA